MKDLVLLVADKNAEFALKGALGRPEALGMRSISFEIFVHSGRDGGARKYGVEMLALRRPYCKRALLLLDFGGCGTDKSSAVELETELDLRLNDRWGSDAKSIVIEPELDVWAWGSDHSVEMAIGWSSAKRIRAWLSENGFGFDAMKKPARPKEALEAVLRYEGLPRSSTLYRAIATKISLRNCSDPAFNRLRDCLVHWFPAVD